MKNFLIGSVAVTTYIIVTIAIAIIVQRLGKISNEALRKTLHFIFLGSYIPLTIAFDVWWRAAIFAGALIALVFPFLVIMNRVPILSALLVERFKGEYLSSMLLALFVMLFSITVCWGFMGERYLVIACIYAWGVGDGVAALVGKCFGRHKIKWRLADRGKSVEGSLAMLACSFLSVFTALFIGGGLSLSQSSIIALLAGIGCTLAELCTKNGLDTVSCPLTAMTVILPLVRLFG